VAACPASVLSLFIGKGLSRDSWPLFVIADYLGSVAHVSSPRRPQKMPSKENKRGGPFLLPIRSTKNAKA
jgi:hypothetical protein